MSKELNKISRKDALKRLGGLSLGLPLGTSIIKESNKKGLPKDKSSSVNIIPNRKPDKPNVLWITTEGVPLSVLSCYGSRIMQTPNIDRIANEGLKFNNSFCNNALCAPSRATLLTGKYNHLVGMKTNPGDTTQGLTHATFDPSQETFPKILKRNGYATGVAGKWHMKSAKDTPVNPGEVGFDYFVFKTGAGGPYYNPDGYLQNSKLGSKKIENRSYSGYITDNFTDLCIDGMKQLKATHKPFFMAMQFFSAHRPFQPPNKYKHIYDDIRIPEPGTFWDDYSHRSTAARKAHMRISDMMDFDPPKEYTSRQRQQWSYQQLMRNFLGTLKAQDDNIGRLLDYLDDTGLSENTIVVFTGDHGFFLGEHGWFDKRFMYEPSLRVPWMIRYPGVTKPGTSASEWVQSIDNAPTILDMLGINIPKDMQGKSIAPMFPGNKPKEWRNSLYYHYYEFAPNHWVLPHYGIRTERYKLIYYYSINEWELFDLKRDPDEMESLFKEEGMEVYPGYENVLDDLLKKLKYLKRHYKDDTGEPVHYWPTDTYN